MLRRYTLGGVPNGKHSMKDTTSKHSVDNKDGRLPSGAPVATVVRDSAQENGELYRFLFETSADPSVICDNHGNVLNTNAAFVQVFGWPLAEIVGKRLDFVPEASQAQLNDCMERLPSVGRIVGVDTKRLTKDGRILDVQLSATVITGKNAEITGNLVVLHVVTNPNAREGVPVAAHQRIADFIQLLPDAVMAIDLTGKVIAWNHAIEEMTGVQAADMLGKGNYEYALPFYGERRPLLVDLVLLPQAAFEQKYIHIQRTGDRLSGETYTPLLKSGSHYVLATAMPLRDSEGNVVGAIETIRDNTERRKMEKVLEESQRRVADIINFLPDAVMVIDHEGTVITWNHALEEMTGVKAVDMLGKGNYEYALPFYGGRRPILVDLVLLPRQAFEQKYTHIQRMGEILFGESYTPQLKSGAHHLSAMASPLRDSQGNVVGAIETIRDNTERRKMEMALAQSQRQLADIINFLPDAVLVIDHEGKVIAWNRAIEEMTGVKAADMLGKGNYDYALPFYGERRPMLADLVLLPDDVLEQQYTHIQRSSEILVAEGYTPYLKGGTAPHMYATASALRDSQGNVVGAIEVLRDNTERKRNQEALTKLYREVESEKQYLESLIQNSPVAIIVMNLNNVITTWNPAAETLFGYTQAEAIAGNVDELVATAAMRAETINHSKETGAGHLVHVVTQRSRKDGTIVDVELLSVPVIVGGERVGLVTMYHDITELQRARRAAEAATLAKSEFLANMSHEIRTPMNGVIGMTSLLLDTLLGDEQREYVETIRKSGDALLAIINDILDFSKIEAGKLELEMQPFDLRECVETAADLVAYRAAEQGVELLTNIELDVPHAVVGDVTRLRQILANLLGNAAKFTESGEIEVAVKKEAGETGEDAECTLHFSVRDTGVGIPPERANRLFQVFSQIDASTTRKFGGTGLGLAICKRLAELMGGDIWAESPGLGKGTTFHFILPFRVAKPIRTRKQYTPNIALREKILLVVDDNATNRLIVNRMTRAWAMHTVDCVSGQEALQKIDAGLKVHAAVLDVQMPEMDGITLSGELRRRRSERALPFVIISSLGQKLPLPPGVNAAAYLHKPVKPSQLYDALVSAFDAQSEQEVAPATVGVGFDAQMGERHPLRILIAEDHPVNQKVMKLMLERLGYRADVVSNGLEVIHSFKRQDYDAVLMDIQMPEMNGLEATQRLRADLSPERQPRIIALTANALGGEREEYLAAGMDDYLSKPVNVPSMRAALEKCMPIGVSQMIGKAQPVPEPNLPVEAMVFTAINIPLLKEYFPYEGEDLHMVIDLAQEFLTDANERMRQLQTAIQHGDAVTINAIAHALKGASLTFGAETFSAMCKELESSGRSADLASMTELFSRAQAEYARVCIELPAILKGMLS